MLLATSRKHCFAPIHKITLLMYCCFIYVTVKNIINNESFAMENQVYYPYSCATYGATIIRETVRSTCQVPDSFVRYQPNLRFSWQIFMKVLSTRFHENLSSGSRVDGRTDMRDAADWHLSRLTPKQVIKSWPWFSHSIEYDVRINTSINVKCGI
jgi:hypothetical protein